MDPAIHRGSATVSSYAVYIARNICQEIIFIFIPTHPLSLAKINISTCKDEIQILCRYPFSGSAPTNLARLHASVSHYSSAEDRYQVRILIAAGVEETAQIVRRIAEETHRNSKVQWKSSIIYVYIMATIGESSFGRGGLISRGIFL